MQHSLISAGLLWFFLLPAGISAVASELVLLTADEYPYQSIDHRGATQEVLAEVRERMAPRLTIRFLPWARALRRVAAGEADTGLFSVSRTREREALFDWCCYLFDYEGVQPYALAGSPALGRFDNPAHLKDASVAVWREDASEQKAADLEAQRIPIGQLVRTDTVEQQLELLLRGRVDLAFFSEPTLRSSCRRLQVECKSLHSPFRFEEGGSGLYIALSRNLDGALRAAFVQAFQEVVASPRFAEILATYRLRRTPPADVLKPQHQAGQPE